MTSFKLLASQAQSINQYKNLRTKVAKCCDNIFFNKQCLYNNVIPKYAQVKVPNTRSVNKVMRLPAYRTIWQYCGLALHMKVR